MQIDEHIKHLEEKLLNPGIRKSAEELDELINDAFIETGSFGKVYNKQQVVEALNNESSITFTIEDFKTLHLSDEIITAFYIAIKENADLSKSYSRRCSIWKKNENGWQIYYHQGTNTNQAL
jgi:hypothetical protein